MTRFLFASFPVSGHMNPGLPIARELVLRGHDVRWYSTPRWRKAIESIGARWIPFRRTLEIDESGMDHVFTDRPKDGVAQLRYDVKNIFIGIIPDVVHDLEEELRREPADVLVGDNTFAGVEAVGERTGIRWAMYGVSVLTIPSRDTAPFGLALNPSSTAAGRLRNRALSWLVEKVIFKEAIEHGHAVRRQLGLSHIDSIFDVPRRAHVFLQGSVASFEYPRTDMPDNLHFIGAAIPPMPADWRVPAWWSRLENGRPTVLVTQGTINNDYDQLVRPAIRALANEEMNVIVTTGSKPAEEVANGSLPANVIVERFVPYAALMPHVDVLLTNGGYGSIQIALANGVPVVAIGKTEEKPEIANRVQWSGVGIGLKVRIPSEKKIRDAIRSVLHNDSYRMRATLVAAEMAPLDATKRGAELLEELAGAEPLERMAC